MEYFFSLNYASSAVVNVCSVEDCGRVMWNFTATKEQPDQLVVKCRQCQKLYCYDCYLRHASQ